MLFYNLCHAFLMRVYQIVKISCLSLHFVTNPKSTKKVKVFLSVIKLEKRS